MTSTCNILCLRAPIVYTATLKVGDDHAIYSLITGGTYLLCKREHFQRSGRDEGLQ